MTVQEIVQFVVGVLRDAGLVGVSVFILVGGQRRWWVWGWMYLEKCVECDFWKDKYLAALELTDRAIGLATTQRR